MHSNKSRIKIHMYEYLELVTVLLSVRSLQRNLLYERGLHCKYSKISLHYCKYSEVYGVPHCLGEDYTVNIQECMGYHTV